MAFEQQQALFARGSREVRLHPLVDAARAEDAQGTPTHSHIYNQVYEYTKPKFRPHTLNPETYTLHPQSQTLTPNPRA